MLYYKSESPTNISVRNRRGNSSEYDTYDTGKYSENGVNNQFLTMNGKTIYNISEWNTEDSVGYSSSDGIYYNHNLKDDTEYYKEEIYDGKTKEYWLEKGKITSYKINGEDQDYHAGWLSDTGGDIFWQRNGVEYAESGKYVKAYSNSTINYYFNSLTGDSHYYKGDKFWIVNPKSKCFTDTGSGVRIEFLNNKPSYYSTGYGGTSYCYDNGECVEIATKEALLEKRGDSWYKVIAMEAFSGMMITGYKKLDSSPPASDPDFPDMPHASGSISEPTFTKQTPNMPVTVLDQVAPSPSVPEPKKTSATVTTTSVTNKLIRTDNNNLNIPSTEYSEAQQIAVKNLISILRPASEGVVQLATDTGLIGSLADLVQRLWNDDSISSLCDKVCDRWSEIHKLIDAKDDPQEFEKLYKSLTGVEFNVDNILKVEKLMVENSVMEAQYEAGWRACAAYANAQKSPLLEKISSICSGSLFSSENNLSSNEPITEEKFNEIKSFMADIAMESCLYCTPQELESAKMASTPTGDVINDSFALSRLREKVSIQLEANIAKSFEQTTGIKYSDATIADKAQSYAQVLAYITSQDTLEKMTETCQNLEDDTKIQIQDTQTLYWRAYGSLISDVDSILDKIGTTQAEILQSTEYIKMAGITVASMLFAPMLAGVASTSGLIAGSSVAANNFVGAALAQGAISGTTSAIFDGIDLLTKQSDVTEEEIYNLYNGACKIASMNMLGATANLVGSATKGALISNTERIATGAVSNVFSKSLASIFSTKFRTTVAGETVELLTDFNLSWMATKLSGEETTYEGEFLSSAFGQAFGYAILGGLSLKNVTRIQNAMKECGLDNIDGNTYAALLTMNAEQIRIFKTCKKSNINLEKSIFIAKNNITNKEIIKLITDMSNIKFRAFNNEKLINILLAEEKIITKVHEYMAKDNYFNEQLVNDIEKYIKNFPEQIEILEKYGIIDAFCSNKIGIDIFKNVNGKTKLTDRTIRELKKMLNNEPLVKPSSNEAKDGEVYIENGKLFMKNGESRIPINISKEKFEELFPYLTKMDQFDGNDFLADCYLVAELDALMDKVKGKAIIYSMFSQVGNDIVVTIPGQSPITFKNGIVLDAGGTQIQGNQIGLKMIEQAYAINRLNNAESRNITTLDSNLLDNANIKGIMGYLAAGKTSFSQQTFKNFMSAISDSYIKIDDASDFEKWLKKASDENLTITCNTHIGPCISPRAFDNISLLAKYGNLTFGSGHANSIKRYDEVNKIVYITDPMKSSSEIGIALNDFKKLVTKLYVAYLN